MLWFLCWRKPDVWSRGTSHHSPQLAPKTKYKQLSRQPKFYPRLNKKKWEQLQHWTWNSMIRNSLWFLCWRKPDVWSRGTSHHAPQLAPKTTNNTKFRDVWKYRLEVQPGSPVQLLYIFFFVLLFHTNFLHFNNRNLSMCFQEFRS